MEYKLHNGSGSLCCKGCSRQDKKLNTYDWLADIPGNAEESDMVEVQFKNTRKGYFRNSNKIKTGIVWRENKNHAQFPAMLIFSDMTSTCADVRNPKGKPMGFYSGRLITLWNCLFPWSGLRSSCTTVRLSSKVRTANSSHGKETQWRVLLTLKL